ncbi:DUF2946 domain-containing protein [Massilia sp. CCM 9210]|uniref:DUF2946 domain-containing protein n=1 Tax=Massilia scottii TaxID=3057166 RepID=UPI002796BF93|nr:DUF2946 domain-containing protein [Massilia sp. CCM 9210]MDQ1811996.1 DUF2946 domain-containing protein [Massilia sp. CCM 9210]
MINIAKRQTLHIWIAMLAILFSTLAPGMARAMSASGAPAGTMEICTANGYKLVKVGDTDASKTPGSAQHGMEHCAFCLTHGGSLGLSGTLPERLAFDAVRDVYPPLFYSAPRSLHAWSTANPRAPPNLV